MKICEDDFCRSISLPSATTLITLFVLCGFMLFWRRLASKSEPVSSRDQVIFSAPIASGWHVLELKPVAFGPIPIEYELWNRLNQPEIARHRTGLMTGFLRETNFKMLEMGELKVTPTATKIFT